MVFLEELFQGIRVYDDSMKVFLVSDNKWDDGDQKGGVCYNPVSLHDVWH